MNIAPLNDQAYLKLQQRLENASEARRRKHAAHYAREQKAAARAKTQGSRTTANSIPTKLNPVTHGHPIAHDT